MMFMNPWSAVCEHCGAAQGHHPSHLLAYRAHCVACGLTLREAGRGLHRILSRANAVHMQLVLAIELEDEFGVRLNDDRMHEDNTLDTFLAAMVLHRPDLAPLADDLRAYAVRFLKESVHRSRVDRVEQETFYDLYASERDFAVQVPSSS